MNHSESYDAIYHFNNDELKEISCPEFRKERERTKAEIEQDEMMKFC
jgi:hypothetical protein